MCRRDRREERPLRCLLGPCVRDGHPTHGLAGRVRCPRAPAMLCFFLRLARGAMCTHHVSPILEGPGDYRGDGERPAQGMRSSLGGTMVRHLPLPYRSADGGGASVYACLPHQVHTSREGPSPQPSTLFHLDKVSHLQARNLNQGAQRFRGVADQLATSVTRFSWKSA